MIRHLLIAEDHPLCASALSAAAQSIDGAIQVEVVETFEDTLARLEQGQYAALLLDYTLRDSKGLANLSTVRAQWPALPVLIISATEAPHLPGRAAAIGARGFQSKTATIEDMKSAITVVLEGGTWFPDLIDSTGASDGGGLELLTPAQLRVMRELVKGHSNKAIAFDLGLTEPTIKSHVSAIFRALGVTNRAQAILALQENDGAEASAA